MNNFPLYLNNQASIDNSLLHRHNKNNVKTLKYLRLLHIAEHGTVHFGFSNPYSRRGQPKMSERRYINLKMSNKMFTKFQLIIFFFKPMKLKCKLTVCPQFYLCLTDTICYDVGFIMYLKTFKKKMYFAKHLLPYTSTSQRSTNANSLQPCGYFSSENLSL